jgi:hypothetical protein
MLRRRATRHRPSSTRRPFVRTSSALIPAVLLASGALILLVGCTSPTQARSPAAPAGCAQPGAASDAVTSTGAIGTVPEVVFAAPLTAAATERTVLTVGSGVPVQTGDTVELGVALYNGRTGARIDARGFGPGTSGLDTGVPVTVNLATPNGTLAGIVKGVTCSTVGSRVAVVATSTDAWGAKDNIDLDLGSADNVIIVVDVLATAASPAPTVPATGAPATGAPDTNVG